MCVYMCVCICVCICVCVYMCESEGVIFTHHAQGGDTCVCGVVCVVRCGEVWVRCVGCGGVRSRQAGVNNKNKNPNP